MWDLPADPFHLLFEGITKQMLSRMFVQTKANEAKQYQQQLSDAFETTKIFSESARRTHAILISNLKGNELGIMTLAIFPHLAANILRTAKDVWYGVVLQMA